MNVFMDITGRDRGFNVGADVLTTTVDGASTATIWNDFQTSLEIYNRTRDPLVSLFTFETTDSAHSLPLDGSLMDFEPASEFGIPKAGRAEPNNFVAGYPLNWFDLALRFTRKYLRDAPQAQIDLQHAAAIEASNRKYFKDALTALTTPVALGARPVNENGASIYSLYAGSSDDAPPAFAGRSFSTGHSHYLVSGAATVDGQDLDDLVETITHHGYGIGTGERIVILVHPDQGKVIRGFRAGVGGSPYDFIPSEAAPAYLTNETVVGQLPPSTFNGLDIIGSFGRAFVIESYYASAGYLIAAAVAGINSPRNALAIRSHVRPELKGLHLVPGPYVRTPLTEASYEIGVGFGVRNRGAAAVMQIKASGSYVAPTI